MSAPSGSSPYFDADVLHPRLEAFLKSRLEHEVRIEGLCQLSAGMSWFTYRFTLVQHAQSGQPTRRDMVLRLAPEVGILPPYRARPEFDLISALYRQGLPVPEALFYCEEPSCLGAPFQIFTKSEGMPHVLADASPCASDAAMLSSWADEFTDILALIHGVDWRTGFGEGIAQDLSVGNVAARQADHWRGIAERVMLRPLPLISYAHHWLLEKAPVAPKLTIVHGDYRIGNFLARTRIDAILDWELAHVGDPHEDLSWALLPMFNGRSEKLFAVMPKEQMFERYRHRTGTEVQPASIFFYHVLSLFKLAIITLAAKHAFLVAGARDFRMMPMASRSRFLLERLANTMEQT